MKKGVVLIVAIIVFALSFSFAASFPDVSEDHWAYKTIIEMREKGFIKGYEDGSFKPENEVSREEFVQMMLNVTSSGKADGKKLLNYYDVPTDRWSYDAVQVFGSSIKESADGYVYFYPTRPIQRQEVAQILSEYFKIRFVGVINVKDELNREFDVVDVNDIKDEYSEAVYNMYKEGLMKGMSDTEFSPESSLTRAQAATLLFRINEKLGKQTPEPTEKVDFDFSFLKLENNEKNMIYSPLSIKYAMSMLNEGAAGNTKVEIDNLIKGETLTKYKNIDKVLSLANSVIIRDTYEEYVKEEYKKAVSEKYDAELIIDAFVNAKNVNSWIENKTFGIIKNMLKDGLFTPRLKMLLVNALAIDMEWSNSFAFEDTRAGNFTKADGTVIEATMMKNRVYGDDVSAYVNGNFKAISMDLKKYGDTQLEFMAIIPDGSLKEYASKLDKNVINDVRSKLIPASASKKDLIVRIPKFSFEYDLGLKDDLISLGMKDAFDEKLADFTNMTTNPYGLFVGEALHKANIEFSEKGVKAAAVTVFAMIEKSSIEIEIPDEITFDKPFVFVIRDKNTGDIWFVGTMYEPNLWEKDASQYKY